MIEVGICGCDSLHVSPYYLELKYLGGGGNNSLPGIHVIQGKIQRFEEAAMEMEH